jgi:integrase/recombinase XerD
MKSITTTQTGAIRAAGRLHEENFSDWIAFIDGAPKTVQTYTRAIRQFLQYLRDTDTTTPTRETVIEYRDQLGERCKPTTVNNYLMAIKQFFKWAEIRGIYPNVAQHVKGAKLDKGFKKDYLTPGQIKEVLGRIRQVDEIGKRDYALLALMVTTGLRTVEVARANIEDIRNVADFTALFIQGKGHREKGEYVKLAAPVEAVIRDYLKERKETAGTAPLFASTANRNTGERLTTRSISRIVKERFTAAGLNSTRLTAHSLRHTAATLNLLNGGTTEETQQLLRHSNINTTLIYAHALERAKNESEDRIAGAIF